jgi:hypothetical protein
VIIALYILSVAVLLFAAWIAAMNWGCVIVSTRNRRRGIDKYHSTVPFVSFFLVVLAILLYPRMPKPIWMLTVPLLDAGNWTLVLGVLWLPVTLIRQSRTKKSHEAGAEIDSR